MQQHLLTSMPKLRSRKRHLGFSSALVSSVFCANLLFGLSCKALAQSDAAFKSDSAAPGVVTLETSGTLGVKKVAITQFVVHFLNLEKKQRGSGGFGGGKTSKVEVSLENLPGSGQLNLIAQGLYLETVEALKAKNIEVLSLDQMKTQPLWKTLSEGGQPSPFETSTGLTSDAAGLMVSPFGYRVETASSDDSFTTFGSNDPKSDTYLGLTKTSLNSPAIAVAEGQMIASGAVGHVLRVRLTVGLGRLTGSAGILSSASTKAEVGLRFAPYFTRWTFHNQTSPSPFGGRSMIYLTDANLMQVKFEPKTVSKTVDEPNALGAIFGLGKGGTLANLGGEFSVDQAAYAKAITQNYKSVAQQFAAKANQ